MPFDPQDLQAFLEKEYGVGMHPSRPPQSNPVADALRAGRGYVPENPNPGPSWLNALRAYLDSTANWAEGRPTPRDILSPPVLPTAGAPSSAAARATNTAAPDLSEALRRHYLLEKKQDNPWMQSPSGAIGAAATGAGALGGALYQFAHGDPLGWPMALLAAGKMAPHVEDIVKIRRYLQELRQRSEPQAAPKP